MEKQPDTSKNWLHRFKNLSLKSRRRRKECSCLSTTNENDELKKIDEANLRDSDSKSTPKSLRRSFKKMQNRVKSCFSKQNRLQNCAVASSDSCQQSKHSIISADEALSHPPQNLHDTGPETQDTQSSNDVMFRMIHSNWYWGPLSRVEAEEKLQSTCDGTFLVRDSASTNYLFSISFRTLGRTLHTRIDYGQGCYSLYDQIGFPSVYELIENAMQMSITSVYCYSTSKNYYSPQPHFPIRFLKPLSRYTSVPTLRHLCRFVIRQCTNINDLALLPLPSILNAYLQEERYIN